MAENCHLFFFVIRGMIEAQLRVNHRYLFAFRLDMNQIRRVAHIKNTQGNIRFKRDAIDGLEYNLDILRRADGVHA